MRTRRLPTSLVCVLVACFHSALIAQSLSAPGSRDTPQKQVVQRGRDAYYSLRTQGLDEFQSTIKPDWALVLKGQGVSDPAQLQAALKLLNGLHFTMFLDKAGKVTVNHSSDNEPPNEQARKGFNQIYDGINQAISGFFDTWSIFMLTSPFPDVNSQYQLDDLGSQYRLSYKEGSSDIVTMLGKDLVISEIKVNSPDFISVIKPTVRNTTKGFVLTGYVGDYTPKSGSGVVHLAIKIDHAPVDGMQLPVTLVADTTLDGAPTHMEMAFSEYRVKSH